MKADSHLQLMAEDFAVRQALARMASELMDALSRTPDPDAAVVGLERYLAMRTAKVTFLDYLREDPKALDLLLQVLGASSFLSEILIRNPEYFHWLFREFDRPGYEPEDFQQEADAAMRGAENAAGALDALKRFKRRELLRIAARDILGKETVESATRQLSDLADAVVERAMRVVGGGAGRRRPFCVLGMGKLGGRELNYSSDIDLIYLYGAPTDSLPSRRSGTARSRRGKEETDEELEKLARNLTRVLTDYTGEGYFYRVDLRLRPQGKGGKIAYSLDQSTGYYEAWGETFERFAMIKARAVAGDASLARSFLEMVQPFVYRKYLDEAALEEMVRLKARTEAAGLPDEAADDNVKTGKGGIREIELFTQILQLLYGGSRPQLRQGSTLAALLQLLQAQLISEEVCRDLSDAYRFLRSVEHRLQIVQERQLHSLPQSPVEREICARRMGFATASEFESVLGKHRDRVHAIYSGLLQEKGESGPLSGREFLRLLNGEVPRGRVLLSLREAGFQDPDGILNGVQALDETPAFAHSRSAVQTLLANLLAKMLPELAECFQPERVLQRMSQVAASTGPAASFFRSLLENDLLRQRLVTALDSGELVAQRLIRLPELIDSLIQSPSVPKTEKSNAAISAAFHRTCRSGLQGIDVANRDLCMEEMRRFRLGSEFKILMRWLEGGSLHSCHAELSEVADCCVQQAADWCAPAVTGGSRAGRSRAAAPSWAIIALGKLGSRELTVHSDLDLVFFYRDDRRDPDRFMRQQALVEDVKAVLESPTPQGVAYAVDTRLRPEGSKGALAMPVQAFERYLKGRAEIWERLAWTRARFVAGSTRVGSQALKAAQAFVYGRWDRRIPLFMDRIRTRMEKELAGEADGTRLDFKSGLGGLSDIEFLLQMIQIRAGRSDPSLRQAGTYSLLLRLSLHSSRPVSRWLAAASASELLKAYGFLRALELFARMESDSRVSWIAADPDSVEALGRPMRLDSPAGSRLLDRYKETTSRVRRIYKETIDRLGS